MKTRSLAPLVWFFAALVAACNADNGVAGSLGSGLDGEEQALSVGGEQGLRHNAESYCILTMYFSRTSWMK